MKTTHKLAMVFLLVGALGLPAAMPFAYAQLQVPGKVIITAAPPATCGLEVTPAGTTLDYGSLAYQQVSSEQTLTLANTGTSAARVDVAGTDWIDVSGNKFIPVGSTHFSLNRGTPYDTSTPLQFGGVSFATIDAGAGIGSYWMLKADLANPTLSGAASHTVTFTSFC